VGNYGGEHRSCPKNDEHMSLGSASEQSLSDWFFRSVEKCIPRSEERKDVSKLRRKKQGKKSNLGSK